METPVRRKDPSPNEGFRVESHFAQWLNWKSIRKLSLPPVFLCLNNGGFRKVGPITCFQGSMQVL